MTTTMMTPKATTNNDRRLLLFDIDGTLITSGGAGEGALKDAMLECFDIDEDLSGITLAGATDALIARLLLEKHGLPVTAENSSALLESYLRHLPHRMPKHAGRLLPGIIELLERLKTHDEFALALLTGNLRRGAEIKLTHYSVWHYFEFGAFADDHHDRNELGHFARSRALDHHGIEFPAESIYVIGDTPRDIECGRAIGAKTVAIATGNYSPAVLEEHRPDFVFADLSDTNVIVSALLG
jgi:phosphoglycolate phosphatase-like HAD superfamily hydrolase